MDTIFSRQQHLRPSPSASMSSPVAWEVGVASKRRWLQDVCVKRLLRGSLYVAVNRSAVTPIAFSWALMYMRMPSHAASC